MFCTMVDKLVRCTATLAQFRTMGLTNPEIIDEINSHDLVVITVGTDVEAGHVFQLRLPGCGVAVHVPIAWCTYVGLPISVSTPDTSLRQLTPAVIV